MPDMVKTIARACCHVLHRIKCPSWSRIGLIGSEWAIWELNGTLFLWTDLFLGWCEANVCTPRGFWHRRMSHLLSGWNCASMKGSADRCQNQSRIRFDKFQRIRYCNNERLNRSHQWLTTLRRLNNNCLNPRSMGPKIIWMKVSKARTQMSISSVLCKCSTRIAD